MKKFVSYKNWVNEKFTDESDPIRDMGIGLKNKIEKWINFYNSTSPIGYAYIRNYHINNDLTIDASWVDLSFPSLNKFPKYIKFNKINTDFACYINDYENFKLCGPKKVGNNLVFFGSSRTNFTKEDIKKNM
jgi:hypothetical protein